MKTFTKLFAAAGLAAAMATPAYAVDTIALVTQNAAGNQSYTGALGMDFDVLNAITVTQLGIYDAGADGFGASTLQVGIFNRISGLQMGPTGVLTGLGGTLMGTDRFVDVADFFLAPGQYSIVAVGFSATNMNGNLGEPSPGTPSVMNAAPDLMFTGGARYQPTALLVLPGIVDGGPVNRYDAGTFMYVSAIPEPSTAAMMLAALGVITMVVRRRSNV